MTTFRAETYQNPYLPVGGTEVHAVVTVTATSNGITSDLAPAGAAEIIIIIDISGSMEHPRTKIEAAREATRAAIDCLRDGVRFGVIAGSHVAVPVYPKHGLAEADDRTRAKAKAAVDRLAPWGGTAMGRWLELARHLFTEHPGTIRHAILLTDGRNETETPEELDERLAPCEGVFQCDCRGVGTDWEVGELRKIASSLLGTVDIVAEPQGLRADFEAMTRTAMAKRTGDVALRLWTPRGATVAFVKQVSPTIEDLTPRASVIDDRTLDYPTGAWGNESRDYHIGLRVPTGEVGDQMRAGRVSLVVDGEVVSQSVVEAVWTEDEVLSTRVHPTVAHYTGQAALAAAIDAGLEAHQAGDDDTAKIQLGRAVQLAAESGNDATLALLRGVVVVEDAATGTVRLRKDVERADEMALETRSTKTVRVKSPEP